MDESAPQANPPAQPSKAAQQPVKEDVTSPLNILLNELMGKKVVVKTNGGSGIRDQLLEAGSYPGVLIGSDNNFIKLEYTLQKFVGGSPTDVQQTILINIAYIITVEEYKPRDSWIT